MTTREGPLNVTDSPSPLTLYTCDQVADRLNIPHRTARELFNRRAVPLVRLGRRLYVRHQDLTKFLDAATIDRQTDDQAGR